MAFFKCLFVVAALVCSSNALNFNWIGGNTNFSNPLNWVGGYGPFSSGVCQTRFGSDTNMVVSRLAPSVYRVGGLKMKNFGKIVLNSGGTRLTFSSAIPVADSCTAVWQGGAQGDQSNNLMCHRNYEQVVVTGTTTTTFPATVAPCEQDTIIFDNATRYQIQMDPFVQRVNIFKIRAIGRDFILRSDLVNLGSDFSLVNKSLLYVGADAGDCLITRTDSKCLCMSSCPTPAMDLEYARQMDLIAQAAAQAAIDQAKLNVTKSFSGEITASALNLTTTQLQNALNNGNRTALQSTIANQLKALWGASDVSITTFELTPSGIAISIAGTVTAPAGTLGGTGGSTIDVSMLTWSSTDGNNLLALLQTILSQGISQTASAGDINSQVTDLTNALVSEEMIAAFKALVNTFVTPLQAYNLVKDLITNPCGTTCINNIYSTWAAQTDLKTRLGVTQSTVQTTATIFGDACDVGCTPIVASLNNVQDANIANTPAAVAQQVVMLSPWLSFATTTPAQRKVFWLDQNNARAFNNFMYDPILGTIRLSLPLGLRVNAIKFRVTGDSVSSRRRRSTTYDVQLQLNYTTTCVPNSLSCEIAPNSEAANSAISQVTNLATVFPVTNPPYFNLTTFSYDWTSLLRDASQYCSSQGATIGETAARNSTFWWTFNIVECGALPRLSNGSCLSPDVNATQTVTARLTGLACVPGATVPPTVTTVATTATASGGSGGSGGSQASSGGSGGSGSTMVFAAAAGGGVVIIIIIVLVVLLLRKRKRAIKPKKADDRTVVAFENPMYDDNTKSAPVYDSSSGISSGGEGLYDEPAFQQSNKQNPLYSSHEALYDNEGNNAATGNPIYDNNGQDPSYAEFGGGEAGYLGVGSAQQQPDSDGQGYLETQEASKDGTGYLDVAPGEEAAADTGYLDQ